MMNKDIKLDWDRYTEQYAEFIVHNNVKHFIELDIDVVVGLKEVERLRSKLEHLTGQKSIPVWHKSRGKEYFVDMCKEYDYVAIGGYANKEIPQAKFEAAFPWFINTAHEYKAKIHGLGYTSCANLRKYHFDSVDSTAWLYGNLGGYIYKFNPNNPNFFDKVNVKAGQRLKPRPSAEHNFNEWRKLQMYANKYL